MLGLRFDICNLNSSGSPLSSWGAGAYRFKILIGGYMSTGYLQLARAPMLPNLHICTHFFFFSLNLSFMCFITVQCNKKEKK